MKFFMNYLTKVLKHTMLVSKHRWYVFKLSIKAGIPWRGFTHDLSKFSFTEFWESVKYYNGSRSPISVSREQNGYSKAWLHHMHHNKHHFEYWEDISKTERIGVFMPYKYIVEAVCDKIAAGLVYSGKKWTQKEPYDYWINIEKKEPVTRHPGSVEFMDKVLKKIYDEGLDSAINKKYLKNTYIEILKKYKV